MVRSRLPQLHLAATQRLCEFAIRPSGLPALVDALAALAGADVGALGIGRPGGSQQWVRSDAPGVDAGLVSLPFVEPSVAAVLAPGKVHRLFDLPPGWLMAPEAAGGDIPAVSPLADACCAIIEIEDGLTGQLCLALAGEAGSKGFDHKALEIIESCLPLLASALLAQRRNTAMQALGGAIMNRYDRYHVGAIVVDADGFVIYRNEAARRHLAAGSGLALRGGRLEAGLPAESAQLLQAIRDVLASDLPDSHFLSRLFNASREGDMPLTLAISPFRSGLDDGGYVTIMAYDPERPEVQRQEVIQWTYQLSARESQLACALAAGESLEHYAERSDCSVEGVRSLLKRIFRKTGTSRQTELVKLVLVGPAAMVQ